MGSRVKATSEKHDLQGGAQFPTGGTAREPKGTIRCDSGADSNSLDGRRSQEAAALVRPLPRQVILRLFAVRFFRAKHRPETEFLCFRAFLFEGVREKDGS